MIVAAFALPMEVRPVIKGGGFRSGRVGGYKIYKGGIGKTDSVLFLSGVGAGRAHQAASAMIAALKPSLYISAGLCGSISPNANVGDVFVADEILSFKEGAIDRICGPEDWMLASPGSETGLKYSHLICADRVLVTASEKSELYEKHPGAAIVDMESAGAARAAQEAGIPFMAVKAVSDGHAEDLPVDFNLFAKSTGDMDMAGMILHVLTHPSTIGPLMKLSRNSKTATENLAAGLAEILTRASSALS